MINHFNEKNRRDLGIVWLIAGLIFLFSGFSGGSDLPPARHCLAGIIQWKRTRRSSATNQTTCASC